MSAIDPGTRDLLDQADAVDGILLDDCYNDIAGCMFGGVKVITAEQEAAVYREALAQWNWIRDSQGKPTVAAMASPAGEVARG